MIIKTFDNGWGPGIPLRDFQEDLLAQYFMPVQLDSVPTVVINSTWYTKEFHTMVMEQLHQLQPKRILLTALLDPAIPKIDQYQELDCAVHGIGYYHGKYEIDAWALIMHQYFNSEFVDSTAQIDTAFMCLNRKPHQHRVFLYNRLNELGLTNQGIVSMGSTQLLDNDVTQGSKLAPNPGAGQYGIVNDIMSLGPVINWHRCFLNIVTETVYDVDREWFVSEKIYKPVTGNRPFLVYAPNGARAWLDHIGLQHYLDDFGDITDLDLGQPVNVPKFLKQLSVQPKSYFQKKYLDLQNKILYNKHMLAQHITATQFKITQGIQCPV